MFGRRMAAKPREGGTCGPRKAQARRSLTGTAGGIAAGKGATQITAGM
jgi:hypothetical protein